jgi:hypothetical protein
MGLDMYLTKKSYVKNWDHMKPEEKHTITVKKGGKKRTDIDPKRISYIVEEVAYWRKFNALHGWFVNECAGGRDDCKEMYVSIETLQKITDILKQVSEVINKSEKTTKVLQDWNGKDYEVSTYQCEDEVMELLPPTKGFFFGVYEIDDWYKQDVERTIKIFEELLQDDNGDYYYEASW